MKVGDYVRTENGIKQIYKIDNNKTVWKYKFKLKKQDGDGCIDLGCFSDNDVIKSSPNIIDLIEKNDLVVDNYRNIYVVDYVFDNYVYTTTKQGNIIKTLCDYQIKSVVTKEQFESMQYNLESEVN